jgi:hypothetical protein
MQASTRGARCCARRWPPWWTVRSSSRSSVSVSPSGVPESLDGHGMLWWWIVSVVCLCNVLVVVMDFVTNFSPILMQNM